MSHRKGDQPDCLCVECCVRGSLVQSQSFALSGNTRSKRVISMVHENAGTSFRGDNFRGSTLPKVRGKNCSLFPLSLLLLKEFQPRCDYQLLWLVFGGKRLENEKRLAKRSFSPSVSSLVLFVFSPHPLSLSLSL